MFGDGARLGGGQPAVGVPGGRAAMIPGQGRAAVVVPDEGQYGCNPRRGGGGRSVVVTRPCTNSKIVLRYTMVKSITVMHSKQNQEKAQE